MITQINVMWKGRKQTLKECTKTFLIFLERLKLNNPSFSIWYERGYSREEGLKNKVIYEYDYIKNKLCTRQHSKALLRARLLLGTGTAKKDNLYINFQFRKRD